MIINDVINLRNRTQPTGLGNTDVLQYDYKFWTELEKLAKKNREKSLEILKNASNDPDKPGTILSSQKYKTVLNESAPINTFSKEAMIEEIIKRCPEVPRHTLRECATAAVVPSYTRKSYVVEELFDDTREGGFSE